MNASSTDSHRVCAFHFPCFVFREITVSFSIIPSARTVIFIFWLQIPPGLNLSEIRAKGRGGLQPGASRDCRPPLGAARKPTTPLGVSHVKVRKPTTSLGLLHGEARKPTAPPGVRHGEARKPTAPPGLLRGEARKPTAPPGLLRGEARKPTTPPGLLHGEARKSTTAVAFARTGLFRPRGRPERRASL